MCKAVEDYVEKKKMEDKIRMVTKMAADKLPMEKIAEYSGLSIEKVKELIEVKIA